MTNKLFGNEGWHPSHIDSLAGKTYLITGANTGAGYQAAKTLLSKGAKVIMLNRSEEKSSVAMNGLQQELGEDIKLDYIHMDLADLASVRKAAIEVLEKVESISALICNAAVAQLAKHTLTQEGFESHLGINHYGHFLLCGMLFNRINKSSGRIVVVGSEGYKMGLKTIQFDDMDWHHNYHPNNTYCHSKLAQIMFAYELQERILLTTSAVKVYVCHPGASKTSLINEQANCATRIVFSIMSMLPIVQSAEKGAYSELMCATEENLPTKAYYGPTGWMNWVGPVDSCKVESFVYDREVAGKLWAKSELATSFKWQFV